MSIRGQILIIFISVMVIFFVINALRKKQLNEEYCLWWIGIMIAMDFLVINQGLLLKITHLIGALVPISTLTLFSIILTLAMLVFFTMKISVLSNQVKELNQFSALQKKELDDLRSKL